MLPGSKRSPQKHPSIQEVLHGRQSTRCCETGRTFDSAYSFSFSVGIGLVLFIAGLVISLTLGQGATIGLIFGIPLLIAGWSCRCS